VQAIDLLFSNNVLDFTGDFSPLMVKDRGWGSRPIEGQDWGTSVSCENTTINELIIRFERSLAKNGTFVLYFID
jgi:hypothetical protein